MNGNRYHNERHSERHSGSRFDHPSFPDSSRAMHRLDNRPPIHSVPINPPRRMYNSSPPPTSRVRSNHNVKFLSLKNFAVTKDGRELVLIEENTQKHIQGLVFVMFFTANCGFCNELKIHFKSFPRTYSGIEFAMMDVGQEDFKLVRRIKEENCPRINISSVPALYMFFNGKVEKHLDVDDLETSRKVDEIHRFLHFSARRPRNPSESSSSSQTNESVDYTLDKYVTKNKASSEIKIDVDCDGPTCIINVPSSDGAVCTVGGECFTNEEFFKHEMRIPDIKNSVEDD